MITHRNLHLNFQQLMADYFVEIPPRDAAVVSWLPFYHDMGLVLGVIVPILGGGAPSMSTTPGGLARSPLPPAWRPAPVAPMRHRQRFSARWRSVSVLQMAPVQLAGHDGDQALGSCCPTQTGIGSYQRALERLSQRHIARIVGGEVVA